MVNKSFRFSVPITNIAKGTGDGKEFYVEGYAATSDLDRQGDIILSEALQGAAKDLKEVNNTAFFGHNYSLEDAVGRVCESQVDENGLKVKIYVSKVAKELRTKLEEGIISKFSIGGIVTEAHDVSKEEAVKEGLVTEVTPFDPIHIITKMELFEVSFVGVPANASAKVVGTFSKAVKELYKEETVKDKLKKEEVLEEKTEPVVKEEVKEVVETVEEPVVKEEVKEVVETVEETPEAAKEVVEEVVEEEVVKEPVVKEPVVEEVKEEVVEETKEEKVEAPKILEASFITEQIEPLAKSIKDISDKLDNLIKVFLEKVKAIEVEASKKSIVKDPKKIPVKKEPTIDESFYKVLTGKDPVE